MSESPAILAKLRVIARDGAVRRVDARSSDTWFSQGLAPARLHEIHAAQAEEGATAAGFAVALTLAASATPILWLRTRAAERQGGRLHATGLIAFGLHPDSLLLGIVDDERALLRAAADAARCAENRDVFMK